MSRTKFVPFRLCVACRKKFSKSTLFRVAKFKNGFIDLDFDQKSPGRGVYVCRNEECFKILKKKRLIEKGLKSSVDSELYLRLENKIKEKNYS